MENMYRVRVTYVRINRSYSIYYVQVGEEDGYEHWQAYAEFQTKQRFSAIKKVLPGVHIQKALGSRTDNWTYCSKQLGSHGTILEWGADAPEHGSRTDIGSAITAINGGATTWSLCNDSATASTYVKYHSGLDKYRSALGMKEAQATRRSAPRQCLLLWGLAGTGKSTWAMTQAWPKLEEIYLKNSANKWWDGYSPTVHKMVIVDEIMIGTPFPVDQLKNLLDVNNNGFLGECKNGTLWVNPQKVILISNYDPRQWFQGATEDSGWQRRIADSPKNPVHVQYVGCPLFSALDTMTNPQEIWREALPTLGVTGTATTSMIVPGLPSKSDIWKTAGTVTPTCDTSYTMLASEDDKYLSELFAEMPFLCI